MPLIPTSIFSRINGSAHRALAAALLNSLNIVHISDGSGEFLMRMIDPNVLDCSLHDEGHAVPAADRALDGLLTFMAHLLGAFTTVDPRVITRQERRNGRSALGV